MNDDRTVTMKYKPYGDSELLCNLLFKGELRPHTKGKRRFNLESIGLTLQEAKDTRLLLN